MVRVTGDVICQNDFWIFQKTKLDDHVIVPSEGLCEKVKKFSLQNSVQSLEEPSHEGTSYVSAAR